MDGLGSLVTYLNNWFETDRVKDTYVIEEGSIVVPFVQDGQYFRIIGSVFNDGVYKYPCNGLIDEVFTGEVWAMAVPPSVIALSSSIEQWVSDNPSGVYTSESFGGYSYTKGTNNGVPLDWTHAFRHELNRWRKL